MTDSFRSYERNLDHVKGDAKGVFDLLASPLYRGKYTVEVAYLSQNRFYSSFPFAISRKFTAIVGSGQSLDLYIGIPDDWSRVEIAKAAKPHNSCANKSGEISYLSQQLDTYLDDPVVQALTALQESSPSGPDDIVVLKLPPAQGGKREYDSNQIRLMANAVLDDYYDLADRGGPGNR